jgi:glycosyltransferase involved in cell wall biosynthesis
MTHEKFPSYFSEKDTTSNQKRELIKKANRVIAVSHNTKKDIVEMFGVEENKVDVVYHGSSISRSREEDISAMNRLNLPGKYILFVGRRNQYKNFTRFVKAIAPLLTTDDELHLLCIGGTFFTKAERELFRKHGIEESSHHRYMNDSDLSIAYANALCFVFPSLYEGFGLPLIEAFNVECPVVCSHSGAMPEIAEKGAEYFDPYSESEIRESVKRVIESDKIRKKITSEGLKRARDFSWEKTAEKTKLVYEGVC